MKIDISKTRIKFPVASFEELEKCVNNNLCPICGNQLENNHKNQRAGHYTTQCSQDPTHYSDEHYILYI